MDSDGGSGPRARWRHVGRRPAGRVRRAWRLRRRRAQVSAVATIFGLLLVVTFIANYLSTTLPTDMVLNDIGRDLEVQNEVGRFASLLVSVAKTDNVGVEVTQPVVLGSNALPPFAGSDGGTVQAPAKGVAETVQLALGGTSTGTVRYASLLTGVVVVLQNTYAPPAQVALDGGGVVFVQSGGIPYMADDPPIALSDGALTIWLPVFTDTVGTEAGTGTAVLAAQLEYYANSTFPSHGVTIGTNGVTITIASPYSSGWMAYFDSTASGLSKYVSCQPSSSTECSTTGKYRVDGPVGTVTVSVPGADLTSVALDVATFSIAVS